MWLASGAQAPPEAPIFAEPRGPCRVRVVAGAQASEGADRQQPRTAAHTTAAHFADRNSGFSGPEKQRADARQSMSHPSCTPSLCYQ